MGSKNKTTTNQTQTTRSHNTFAHAAHPGSADITALRGMVADPNEVDPGIAYNAGMQRRDYNNTFKNPLGSYQSPALREAAERSAARNLGMQESISQAMGRAEAQERAFGQQSYIASLTNPTLVQTGGTSTGTMSGTNVQQYNPGIGSYIAQGAGAAVGFL